MSLATMPYLDQVTTWPGSGRHVLAQADAETVVVYQAFKPEIGLPAARAGRFGTGFSRARMSWVKPGFLWMMARSGWATKHDQEVVLGIRVRRPAFFGWLEEAVLSAYVPGLHADEATWREASHASDVVVQWDPDHDPSGASVGRRVVQIGLRGRALARYCDEDIVGIEDVTPFVSEQSENARPSKHWKLQTPVEAVLPLDERAARRLGAG